MRNENKKIQSEIIKGIMDYFKSDKLTFEQCNDIFEERCSIWDLEDLTDNFKQDNINVTVEDVKNMENVTLLSSGEYLAIF